MEHAPQPPRFSWRLFWLLFALAIVGLASIIPIAIDLFGPVIMAQPLPLPLPLILLLGAAQNLILLALMVFLGLKIGQKVGLGAPLLEGWLTGKALKNEWRASLRVGVITGLAIGAVVMIGLISVAPLLPNLPLLAAAKLAIWKRLLACLYGGLDEEILSRLFLLTLIAWLVNKAFRKSNGHLSLAAFWISNLLVAILFGLGHLPSASLVMPITPLVVAMALSLNGIAAVGFGVLYKNRGLEAAMIAHFTADLMIWVVGPAILAA